MRAVRRSPYPLLRLGITLVLALVAAAACSTGAGRPDPTVGVGTPLRVVTTTTVFADIVQAVGGDRVETVSIIPPGVGPEDFEPKPEDVRALSGATLIVSGGVGLDDFLQKMLDAASEGSAPQLVLGDGIPTIDVDGTPNPHFWLDPTLVKQHYVPAIAAKLAAIDPAGEPTYRANAAAYAGQLDALDQELKGVVDTIPVANRMLVTFHDAFPYLAQHFGFDLVGVILPNPGQDPSASQLADLVQTVKAAGVKAVFSEAQSNPKLAQTLAEETGVKVVTSLYNDALGPAPADTYLGLMRYDIGAIADALR